MVDGIAERLIGVPRDIGVKRDHLANGHMFLPAFDANGAMPARFRLSLQPPPLRVPILFRSESGAWTSQF
jgi:hypothetical protein